VNHPSFYDALNLASQAVVAAEAGYPDKAATALLEASMAAMEAFDASTPEAEALGVILAAAGQRRGNRAGMTRLRRILAAFALAAGAALGAAACGPPSGSPNCPPGQWWVEKPGSGWECAPGTSAIYTPTAFAPGGSQ